MKDAPGKTPKETHGPADAVGKAAPSQETGTLWGRRSWMTRVFWGALAVPTAASGVAAVRYLFPRVLFEPPTIFNAGRPEAYETNMVSTRWKKEYKVWVVRTTKGFYALYASCTHLGCTPEWSKDSDKFKCFCHGSGFRFSGANFEGPAPRALERCKIALNEDGEILIDTSQRFRQEDGGWDMPEAFLRI